MWISTDFNRLKQPIVDILENSDPSNNFVALDIDSTVLRVLDNRRLEPEPAGLFVRDVAKQNKLPVVYITARVDSPGAREVTLDELSSVGIDNPAMVVLRPASVRTWEGISHYKADSRSYVESQTNSRCVMNVGDQWTDLLPLRQSEFSPMRRTFEGQHLLFSRTTDTVERWSVKLRED